jgi:hypothetical protein
MNGEKPESLVILPTGSESHQAGQGASKKIFQDLKFLQQFFTKMPDHGNQVIVVNVGEISGSSNGDTRESPFGLIEYIESLPQPRLKNLIREACRVSIEKCRTQTAGADFLGTTRRVIGWQLDLPDEVKMTAQMMDPPEASTPDNTPPADKGQPAPALRKHKRYMHSEEWKSQHSANMKAYWRNRKREER